LPLLLLSKLYLCCCCRHRHSHHCHQPITVAISVAVTLPVAITVTIAIAIAIAIIFALALALAIARKLTDVSRASLYRWTNHPHPYHQTGGPGCTTIVGVDMIHLITFIVAHSDATQDKMAPFIYNEGGELFSKLRISEHLKNLKITKKKASIKAFQALDEEVQFRVFTFWNYLPPLGIFEVP
jgi:hypothetical protein